MKFVLKFLAILVLAPLLTGQSIADEKKEDPTSAIDRHFIARGIQGNEQIDEYRKKLKRPRGNIDSLLSREDYCRYLVEIGFAILRDTGGLKDSKVSQPDGEQTYNIHLGSAVVGFSFSPNQLTANSVMAYGIANDTSIEVYKEMKGVIVIRTPKCSFLVDTATPFSIKSEKREVVKK